MADITIDILFRIAFLTLSNIKVNFINQKLKWRLYTITKTLITTKQVKLIEKKEFIATASDLDDETFIMYVTFLISSNLDVEVHPS